MNLKERVASVRALVADLRDLADRLDEAGDEMEMARLSQLSVEDELEARRAELFERLSC